MLFGQKVKIIMTSNVGILRMTISTPFFDSAINSFVAIPKFCIYNTLSVFISIISHEKIIVSKWIPASLH